MAALVVETGAGITGADSFGTTASADTYLTTNRPGSAWDTTTTANKEKALRYAATWLDGRYEYPSTAILKTQAFGLPRATFYDRQGREWTPALQVARAFQAQCEAALAHIASALNEVRDRGGAVESIRVGPISKSWATSAAAGRTFPFIDGLMAPLIIGGPGVTRLVR